MNALVMFDRETRTLWSQFLSQAVEGDLAGTKLDIIPLTMTTWEKWKEIYPDTVALRKPNRGSDPYVGYYSGRSAGVIGEANKDDRLPTKELVLGLGAEGEPVAVPHSQLRTQPLVNLMNSGEPVVVYFEPDTATALAFAREVDGQVLDFELIEKNGREWLQDEQTGTLWVPFTGQAVNGELAGKGLKRLNAVNVFWFAWSDFYPNTEVWSVG